MKEHHHGQMDPHHHMKEEGHKDMAHSMAKESHLEVHHHEHMKEPMGHTIHAMDAQEGGIGMTEMKEGSPHHEMHVHHFTHPSTEHMHKKGELPNHAKGMGYK